jgi:hypothetical protein
METDDLDIVRAVGEQLEQLGVSARIGGTREFPCLRFLTGDVSWSLGIVGDGAEKWGWDRVAPTSITSGYLCAGPSARSVAEAMLALLEQDKAH